jgi:hypothetical protein
VCNRSAVGADVAAGRSTVIAKLYTQEPKTDGQMKRSKGGCWYAQTGTLVHGCVETLILPSVHTSAAENEIGAGGKTSCSRLARLLLARLVRRGDAESGLTPARTQHCDKMRTFGRQSRSKCLRKKSDCGL